MSEAKREISNDDMIDPQNFRQAAARPGFEKDERAIAAVEFALILPLMLMIYLGLAEMSRALRAAQRTDLVAHVMSDLIAQQLTGGTNSGQAGLSDSDFTNAFSAATTLMNGLPTTTLKITISEINITQLTSTSWKATTDWTVTSKSGAAARACTLTGAASPVPIASDKIPMNYVSPTGTPAVNPTVGPIIIADVKYVYSSGVNFADNILSWFHWSTIGTFTFQRTAYATVRNTYVPPNIQLKGTITGKVSCT